MVMANSPLAEGSSYGPAVFALAGSLIGGLIAGVFSFGLLGRLGKRLRTLGFGITAARSTTGSLRVVRSYS
jgi:hypothetical protein